jgi:hypothetical protein
VTSGALKAHPFLFIWFAILRANLPPPGQLFPAWRKYKLIETSRLDHTNLMAVIDNFSPWIQKYELTYSIKLAPFQYLKLNQRDLSTALKV